MNSGLPMLSTNFAPFPVCDASVPPTRTRLGRRCCAIASRTASSTWDVSGDCYVSIRYAPSGTPRGGNKEARERRHQACAAQPVRNEALGIRTILQNTRAKLTEDIRSGRKDLFGRGVGLNHINVSNRDSERKRSAESTFRAASSRNPFSTFNMLSMLLSAPMSTAKDRCRRCLDGSSPASRKHRMITNREEHAGRHQGPEQPLSAQGLNRQPGSSRRHEAGLCQAYSHKLLRKAQRQISRKPGSGESSTNNASYHASFFDLGLSLQQAIGSNLKSYGDLSHSCSSFSRFRLTTDSSVGRPPASGPILIRPIGCGALGLAFEALLRLLACRQHKLRKR